MQRNNSSCRGHPVPTLGRSGGTHDIYNSQSACPCFIPWGAGRSRHGQFTVIEVSKRREPGFRLAGLSEECHGESREIFHSPVSPCLSYNNLSCIRFGLPCQNSYVSGHTM